MLDWNCECLNIYEYNFISSVITREMVQALNILPLTVGAVEERKLCKEEHCDSGQPEGSKMQLSSHLLEPV